MKKGGSVCHHHSVQSSHKDKAIIRTCDHVFDKIGVTRAVCVGVVPVFGGVLDVGHVNGYAALLLLRGVVNLAAILLTFSPQVNIFTFHH